VGGKIFSEVSDHTSTLRFIEEVAAAGGLSGKGPVTFTPISRWRRDTMSDYTGALNNIAAQAAPSNTQFDASTRSTFAASQSTASKQAMPGRPGAAQDFPYPSSAAAPGSNVD
jgi:phospholipase C